MYEKNEQKRCNKGSKSKKSGRIVRANTQLYSEGTPRRQGKQSGTTINDGDTRTGECTT